jgi:hypothetical protein
MLAMVVVVLATAALVGPTHARAASTSSCAKAIVDDWYGDGKIDKIYKPLSCYKQAIRSLGVDLAVYQGAEDDINRALLYAQKNKLDPGDPGSKGGGTDTSPVTGPDPSTTGPDTQDPTTPVDTSGPSAVPLPVILLGGFALLLLAAGGAGYLNRRAEARRADGPAADDDDDF